MMIGSGLVTRRELKIIDKKLKGRRLNQLDSNCLTRSIRPKLKKIISLDAVHLLQRLEYNQKAVHIENALKEFIIQNVKSVSAIVVYGSAIQTNYKSYNDLDVLVVVGGNQLKNAKEKYGKVIELKQKAKNLSLNLDIRIISKESFYLQYRYNPSLIYQLKDSKIIYGKLQIPKKINIPKIVLRMKLDWSDIVDINSSGREIYEAIRNALLVKLLFNKIVDNHLLLLSLEQQLGRRLIQNLKYNKVSNLEKKIALMYLKEIVESLRKEVINAKWEKMVLLNL